MCCRLFLNAGLCAHDHETGRGRSACSSGGDGAGISGCVPGIVHAIAITVRRSCLGATGRLPADARTPLKRERKLVQADPHLDADAARLQRLAAFAGAPRRTLPGPGHRLAVRTGQRYRPRSRRWRCGHHGGRPVGALAGSSPGGAQGHPGPDGRQRRCRCRIRSGATHRRRLRANNLLAPLENRSFRRSNCRHLSSFVVKRRRPPW